LARVWFKAHGLTKTFSLGPWGSEDSYEKYTRLCVQLRKDFDALANGAPIAESTHDLLVIEACEIYLTWLRDHPPRRPEGTDSQIVPKVKRAIMPLWFLYGGLAVDQFGLAQLAELRESIIDGHSWWREHDACPDRPKTWCRRTIVERLGLVVKMFAWLEERGHAQRGHAQALRGLSPLSFGSSGAAEPATKNKTVDDHSVETAARYASPTVATMLRVQRLSGMRPDEICLMRPCDLSPSPGDSTIVLYRPWRHKLSWQGKDRTIGLSLQAQALLAPFLENRAATAYLFSPAESQRWWFENRGMIAGGRRRKTKIFPCEIKRRAAAKRARARRRRRRPTLTAGDHYTPSGYRQAVGRAIDKAIAAGEKSVRPFTPRALRHARLTEVQAAHGWDAAQSVGGHASPTTTAIYAHDLGAAARDVISIENERWRRSNGAGGA